MISVQGNIDRIEDGKMVIVAEALSREFVIDASQSELQEGDWVTLEVDNNEVVNIYVDDETTQARRKRIGHLKRSLKRRNTT